MKLPTRKQLERFQAIRAKATLPSNLQFHIDLQRAGLRVQQIGTAARIWDESGQPCGYRWDVVTPSGNVTMTERQGRITLD